MILIKRIISHPGHDGTFRPTRHWKGEANEVGMLPNVKELDEQQARQLVHWILSFAASP